MARRRLENAIQAAKAIEEGQDGVFSGVEETSVYMCEAMREGVFSLQYSYDGKMLVVGYGDGSMQVLSATAGTLLRDVRRHKQQGMAVSCIRFNPREQHVFLASSVEGKVHAGSVLDGTCTDVVSEPNNEINCLDFNLDGSKFGTSGKDMDVHIYDTETNKCKRVYEGYDYNKPDNPTAGHSQRVFALKYHPEHDGVFITGGWDNHLKIWDERTAEGVIRAIPGPHICGDSLDIKGNQILTGSWVADEALQLWDFRQGSLIKTLPFSGDQGEFIYCAQFADNDVVLAGGSGSQNVQAVNTATAKRVGRVELGHPVQALDNIHGGRMLALGGAGLQIKMAAMT